MKTAISQNTEEKRKEQGIIKNHKTVQAADESDDINQRIRATEGSSKHLIGCASHRSNLHQSAKAISSRDQQVLYSSNETL